MNDRLRPTRPAPPTVAGSVEPPRRPAHAAARWRVDLLGGFRADDGARCLTRLHSRHVVALLARLALWPQRDHPREELIELLWPGVALAVGRNRLRQALSSLRNVLEAPGLPGAPLLQADRLSVRLAAGGVACDVREFERCAARGERDAALALYRGELLPGFYDEWVLTERARLEALRDALEAPPPRPGHRPGELAASREWADGAEWADRTNRTNRTDKAGTAGTAGTAGAAGLKNAASAASATRGAGARPAALGQPPHAFHAAHPSPPHHAAATTAPRAPRPAAEPRAVAERGLPSYLTPLFGAEAQTTALRRAVQEHRLVTVVGPGGGGKTRLAIEVARRLHWADAWVEAAAGDAAAEDRVDDDDDDHGHDQDHANRAPDAFALRPAASPTAFPTESPAAPFATSPAATAAARSGAASRSRAGAASPALDPSASPFDSITLVPLLDARSQAQLLDALRSALRLDAAADVLDGVVGRLAGRRALLLLDNFEQLVGQGEGFVARLAAALPQLHVLVTSRRSLGVDGERLFALAPLALPEAGAPLAAAVANPAVALFADRATAVRGDFRLGARNHAAIVALVRLLEGSPLAIELAASRVRSFAPFELLERLRQPPLRAGATPVLDLLARHAGAAPDARHASLNRTIAWSWALLDAPQRALACAMTVFRGGCTAAMLQAVVEGAAGAAVDTSTGAAGEGNEAPAAEARVDARLGLDELLAHSLVQTLSDAGAEAPEDDRETAVGGTGLNAGHDADSDSDSDTDIDLDPDPGAPADRRADGAADATAGHESPLRFQLYEPIREFAAAQLSPSRAAHWRARHRAWAIDWAEALPLTVPLAAVRAERPNLEAAFASAAEDDAADDAVRLLLALRRALRFVALAERSLDHIAAAIARCDDTGLRIRARGVLAIQLIERSRKDDAQHQVEAGLAEAPPRVLPLEHMPAEAAALRGLALVSLAWQRWRSTNDAARVLPLVDEAQPLAERSGDVELQFDLLALHGFAVSKGRVSGRPDREADPALPQALHRRGLALRLASGDRHAVLSGRYNLGQAIFVDGDWQGGLAEFRAVAAQARAIGNWQMRSRAEGACGCALSELHQWPESVAVLRQTLRSCWEESLSGTDLAYGLWNLARPLAHVRLPLVALQVAGFIAVHWVRHIGELSAEDRFDLRRIRRLCAVQCPKAACDEAWRRGETMALADAVALALGGGKAGRSG